MKLRSYATLVALCAPVVLAGCASSPKPEVAPAPAPVAAPAPAPAPAPMATPQQNQADHALVKQVQTLLKQDHLYRGHIDGVYGRMSARGVAAFQKHSHLPVTGQLDEATLSAMKLQPASGGMSQ